MLVGSSLLVLCAALGGANADCDDEVCKATDGQAVRASQLLQLDGGLRTPTRAALAEDQEISATLDITYEGRSCGQQAKNLGKSFSTVEGCALAAARDAACGEAIMYPTGDLWNRWGCRCCSPGGAADGEANIKWNVYSYSRQQWSAQLLLSKRNCGQQAKNLGTSFSTVEACALVAAQDAACGEAIMYPIDDLWSDRRFGCRCCSPGEATTGRKARRYNVYTIVPVSPKPGAPAVSSEVLYQGRECAQQGKVLGSFGSLQQCAQAVRSDPACGSSFMFKSAAPAGQCACCASAWPAGSSNPSSAVHFTLAPAGAVTSLAQSASEQRGAGAGDAPPYNLQCATMLGEGGASDGGEGAHACEWCSRACNQQVKQKSLYLTFDFTPPLEQANIFDVETKVQWNRFQEYKRKGIYHALRFIFARSPSLKGHFGGYAGPQIKGGVSGQHLFSIWDTVKPNADGTSPSGRRLALPAADPGLCERNCQDCGLHPDLKEAGVTTGTQCKTGSFPVQEGDAFVYRLRMSNPSATTEYNGEVYQGTEWEVLVTDLQRDEVFVLGRVLFEGDIQSQGIRVWKKLHEHTGCTPCDAFYERTTAAGPFILAPQGVHTIEAGHLNPSGSGSCTLYRVISLSNLEVQFETGPGVSPAPGTELFNTCHTPAGA